MHFRFRCRSTFREGRRFTMAKFGVDFVYKTYHTVEIEAESPDKALDQVMKKTYGVQPNWEPDEEFLKQTLEEEEYYRTSVEAHVHCQYVWHVHMPDDGWHEFDIFDTEEEAREESDGKYEITPEVQAFDKKEYAIQCKFDEFDAYKVGLREEHILAILPALKREIEGDRDSVAARIAYNRLVIALDGEKARDRCYATS